MTLVEIIIFLVVVFGLGFLAWLVITKYFSPTWQKPSLAVVGIIMLIALLIRFVPQIANFKVL